VFTLRTDSCSITGAGVELLRNLVQTRMVKISICANFQINATQKPSCSIQRSQPEQRPVNTPQAPCPSPSWCGTVPAGVWDFLTIRDPNKAQTSID
jgi:hypothetical protein